MKGVGILQRFKRFVCGFFAALILTFSVVSDYQDASVVYATGTGAESTLYYALRSLIQTVMVAEGFSFANDKDLDISTQGLQNFIESYKDCDDFGDVMTLNYIYTTCIGKKVGDVISFGAQKTPVYNLVKNFIKSEVPSSSFSNNKQVESTGSVFHSSAISQTEFTSKVAGAKPFWDKTYERTLYDFVNPSKDFFAYKLNSGGGVTTYRIINAKDVVIAYDTSDKLSFSLYNSGGVKLNNIAFKNFTLDNGYFVTDYKEYTASSMLVSSVAGIYTKLHIYDSLKQYQYMKASQTATLTDSIYGSSTAAKDAPDTVTVTQEGVSQQIQDAITKAKAENPSITQADLDAAVAKIISETKTDTSNPSTTVDTSTVEGLIKETNISVKTLTDTVTQFRQRYIDGSSALQEDVDGISDQFTVIDGGGSDEEPDKNDDPKIWIPPGFFASKLLKPLMEYFGNPVSEITKFLNKIMNSVKSLPQLFDKAGELYIGHIYSDLSSIVSYVGSIQQYIKDLPKNIADLIEIPEIKPDEIVEAFNEKFKFPPIEIPEISIPEIKVPDINIPAIEVPEINIPEIKVPDVKIDFPSIPDYTGILNNILDAIKNMFVVDTDAVSNSASGLSSVWEDHIPFFGKLIAIFKTVKFKDEYTYPVIKIKTPHILESFYAQEYIILLDFADYKRYFSWARNIIRYSLWIAFCYSILNRFKVRFVFS